MTPGQPRLCVILCPPWPRSGSSSLFAAQARAYLAMGFAVAVVAVPQDHSHVVGARDFWSQVAADFRFDPRQAVFLNRSTRQARPLVSRCWWSWLARGCDSAIAIEARIAAGSAFDPAFVSWLDRGRVEVIHVNHCVNLGAARGIASRAAHRQATILLDTQDVQAERYRESEVANPFTRRPDAASALARDELALCRPAAALLHLTLYELEHFRRLLPHRPHFLLRPTTRNEPPAIVPPRDDAVDFLYVGDGHRANVRSIRWFLDEVLPRLDTSRLRLRIAGGIADHFSYHEPALFAAHRELWLGRREAVGELYAASRFVMVPMTGGSGISIKLVEALAMGKPIVASPRAVAAFQGIAGLGEAMTIAESPAAFAAAMTALAARQATVNAAGRALYDRHFSNARYAEALAGIVAELRPALP